MAEKLTQEQLLLLDNLMYLQDITNPEYDTIDEVIQAYDNGNIVLGNENLSGGFEKNIDQMEKVLEAISKDPELTALGIKASTGGEDYKFCEECKYCKGNADCNTCEYIKASDKGENYNGPEVVRATCFTQYDEAGNAAGHVVAFRGTGGVYGAWKDNFEGLYETDTEAQIVVGI